MILYHFTGLEYLDAIMEDGLSKGDVPTSATEGKPAYGSPLIKIPLAMV
jgi:hypothetical protein